MAARLGGCGEGRDARVQSADEECEDSVGHFFYVDGFDVLDDT